MPIKSITESLLFMMKMNGEKREHYMYPNEARLRNMTYGFTIHYDVDVKFKILIDKKDGSSGKNKFRLLEHTETYRKNLFRTVSYYVTIKFMLA